MNQRITLLIALVISLSACTSTKPDSVEVMPSRQVSPQPARLTDTSEILPNAEEVLNQAKIHYSDALMAVYDNDTLSARYEFEQALDALRQVQDMDELEPWAEDESILLTQKITEDLVQYVDTRSDPGGMSHNPTSLQERISLIEPVEEVEWEAGEFKVLDDRDGHIPIILNARVERIIAFFQNQGRDDFQEWLNRINRYQPLFTEILKDYTLPTELFYLALIESGLNPKAYSYAHASGPWQFITSTGKVFGLERNWWIDERRDPVKSTHAAAKYLTKLYNEFEDWYLAMSAYNAGERRVWRAIRREGTRDFWSMRTLPRQTRNYIPTFLAATIIANHPEEYGFTIAEAEAWSTDTVTVHRGLDLNKVASAMDVKVESLRALNPEIRRWVTPPGEESYTLRLPEGTRPQFIAVQDELPEAGVQEYASHRVRYGENLSLIARKYRVSLSSIARANNLRNWHQLKVGQRLIIPVNGFGRTQASSKTIQTNIPGKTPVKYLVRKGDTLGEIAEVYHTRASYIRRWNGLRYGEYIYPGQSLTIWVPETSQFVQPETAVDGNYQIYVVQRGDTLWDIARRHGVNVTSLKSWNTDMASGYIKPGDKIKIRVN